MRIFPNWSSVSACLMIFASLPASAADLPAKKLREAPPQFARASSWQGPYIGFLAGAIWGQTHTETTIASSTLAMFPPIIPTINAAGTNNLSLRGALVGGEAGYNFEVTERFILGVESDLSWTSLSGSTSTAGMIPIFNGPFSFNQPMKADWIATFRGRAGIVVYKNLLAYATGGLALTRQQYASTFADSFNEFEFYRKGGTRTGWTLGGGLEYAFGDHWSAKVEYLHTAFDGTTGTGFSVLNDASIALVGNRTARLTTDSVRFGINYRITPDFALPIIAKY